MHLQTTTDSDKDRLLIMVRMAVYSPYSFHTKRIMQRPLGCNTRARAYTCVGMYGYACVRGRVGHSGYFQLVDAVSVLAQRPL